MAKKHLLLNRIYEFRIIYDLTIKDIANASNMSESAISDIENGIKQPTHPTMLKICRGFHKFGLKFEEIFTTDPSKMEI